MSETDCLFCKILAGTAAADVVYQDNRCVVIRDVKPQAPTHVLVVPKKHVASLDELVSEQAELAGRLFLAAQEVVRRKLKLPGGWRCVVNTGSEAGQTVLHVHLHVLAGRAFSWPPG